MPLVSRFPLVPRPRPTATRLSTRIAGLVAAAHTAADGDDTEALTAAAAVHTHAAWIASDAGLPTLATHLCWHHSELYRPALPLNAVTARLALEPLVNVARLAIHGGDGIAATELLDALHGAVQSAKSVRIDGREVPCDRLIAAEADQVEIGRWLWSVRRADGLRALAAMGQWSRAAVEARRMGGVGERLLDGRQIVIVDRVVAGDSGSALEMVESTAVTEEWDAVVLSLLALLCRVSGGMSVPVATVDDAVERWHALPAEARACEISTQVTTTLTGRIAPDGV